MSSEENNKAALHARYLLRNAVRSAFSSAGFSEREHNAQLQAALKITQSAAYRKLNMDAGWSDTDISGVASYLDQKVESLFASAAGLELGSKVVQACIDISGRQYDCMAEVAKPLAPGEYSDFLLVEGPAGNNCIVPFVEAADDALALRVIRFEVASGKVCPPQVAVLEDDVGALESACEILKQRHLNAIGFQTIGELRKEISGTRFDIIVLDWWVNGESAASLIYDIRSSELNRDCTLVVVTGELFQGGKASLDELERMITTCRIKTHMKPVHWALLAAEWSSTRDLKASEPRL